MARPSERAALCGARRVPCLPFFFAVGALQLVREWSGVYQVAEIGGLVTGDVSLADVCQKGEGRCCPGILVALSS